MNRRLFGVCYPGYKDREGHSNGRFIWWWLKMEIITIPIIRKLQNETSNIEQNTFAKKKKISGLQIR